MIKIKPLIIVPAYNEALNIEKTIKNIKENTKFDYVIINDCSTDNTKEIVKKMSTDYECVKITNWKEYKDIIDNIDEIDKKC